MNILAASLTFDEWVGIVFLALIAIFASYQCALAYGAIEDLCNRVKDIHSKICGEDKDKKP